MIDPELCVDPNGHCNHAWSHDECCKCSRVWLADGLTFQAPPGPFLRVLDLDESGGIMSRPHKIEVRDISDYLASRVTEVASATTADVSRRKRLLQVGHRFVVDSRLIEEQQEPDIVYEGNDLIAYNDLN